MITEYKYSVIKRRFLQFCRRNNISPEDLLAMCEGRVSNFPYWYADYVNKFSETVRYRILTGDKSKFTLDNVWG